MRNNNLDTLMSYLNREEDRYVKILKKHYRARRVERDTFFSSKDRNILIESFVIGGLLEKAAEKIISRIFEV